MEREKPDGAIWDKGNKLSLKIGEDMFNLDKIEDKETEKHPDYKGENIAAWARVSKNGNDYLFIKEGEKGKEKDYVAFKNGFKKTDKQPDWIVRKSKPMKKDE